MKALLKNYGHLLFVAVLWSVYLPLGMNSVTNLGVGLAVLVLRYSHPRARDFLDLIFPALLTLAVYQAQVFYVDILRGPIHVIQPHEIEIQLFGISSFGELLTPAAWWQSHTAPWLDALCGVFYLTFIGIFVAITLWFYFRSAREQARLMMWAYFWVNIVGYVTYLIYPAAPPWYVDLYGLQEPAVLTASAHAAGALRFDELFGVNIFQNMYSHSTNVFGAIPSLHVAYPMVAVTFCSLLKRLRVISVVYFCGVAFSAIYLNHHYIIDLLVGIFYAILMSGIIVRCALDRPLKVS